MKITGQILKENRERKGVSLTEVSLSTKITIKTLAAIESGDPATLPPKTFLRGFVRSYAIYLGCDVEEILRTFHEEMGSTLSRPALSGPNPSELNAAATEIASGGEAVPASKSIDRSGERPGGLPERRAHKRIDAEATLRDETSLVTKGGIFGGIFLLIILIVFLKGKMDSYESERTSVGTEPTTVETVAPSLDPAIVPEDAATDAETDARREAEGGGSEPTSVETAVAIPVTSPTATPTPTPTPTPKPTATPTPTPTPKPIATPTPTPTPKPTATPTPTPTPKPTATPGASPKPSPTPATAPAAAAGKSHEILIEALDAVDVEITVDGETPRTIKLRGEQVQSIKVKRKASLKLSDGGAVNLIVNGVDRGVPGDLGKPTRVELP